MFHERTYLVQQVESKNLINVYTSRHSAKAYQPHLADIDCTNHSVQTYSAARPLAKLV